MGTWNYRIVKYLDAKAGYGLHEVFYDDKGKPWSMTKSGAGFYGDTPAEIIKAMKVALRDAKTKPLFKEPKKWPGNPFIARPRVYSDYLAEILKEPVVPLTKFAKTPKAPS